MQQRYHHRHHAPDAQIGPGLCGHGPVEFYDIRLQIPHPVEIGMAGAEVVQCDQESAFAEELHGFAEAHLVPRALFQDFEEDPMRRQAGCVEQVGEEIVVVHAPEEYFGVHVEEQPAVRPEMQEIVHVDSAREPVEGHDVREIPAHAEGIERRNRIAVRVRRTHQTFESHRATVGNAENRLEMTANFKACEISDGLFGARLQQTTYRLQVYTGRANFWEFDGFIGL